MKVVYLIGLAIIASLSLSHAQAKTKESRKPAQDISSTAGISKDMQRAVETHWMFKPIRQHYKSFYVYSADLADTKSDNVDYDGDKKITLMYATYKEDEKDSPEDSISFTAVYNSRKKTILKMTVEQGPCTSDMCGP